MSQDRAANGEPAADPWAATINRFSGYAADYDSCRPGPPCALVDFLAELSQKSPLERVVDLGCGTGLSTRVWADRAADVVGVDPSADMVTQAKAATKAENVQYLCRLGHGTGLPDRCADIVTCGMSLHWMDPELTALEVGRILRPGGVFGTYWEHWSSPFVEVDQAFGDLERQAEELHARLGASATLKRWPRRAQEKRLASSGLFAFTKEIAFHHVEHRTADQLTRMVRTLGLFMVLVKLGLSDDTIGLARFAVTAGKAFGDQPQPIYHTWGLWYGVARP